MRQLFRDAAHLFRLAGLFLLSFALFVLVRGLVVPADFGRYGHYRAGAIDDNRLRTPVYAGGAACGACHADVVRTRQGSRHERIGCEACHGPLARHAEDPAALQPERPPVERTCLVCHRQTVGKPQGFPAIDPEEHAAGASCKDCHDAHHPDFE
jgi:hypothetical protein